MGLGLHYTRVARRTDITSGLQLDRAEVLTGFWNFWKSDRSVHHTADRSKKNKGTERTQLKFYPPKSENHTNIGKVSTATVRGREGEG